MINIVENKDVNFTGYRFDETVLRSLFTTFEFNNGRPITKAILVWWAMQNTKQQLPSLEVVFETEHIFARNRQDKEKSLKNVKNLEALGNKAILEKRINIRASDYKFIDKVKYYKGYTTSKGQLKDGTKNQELLEFSENMTDFLETDIESRTQLIVNSFIEFLKTQQMI